MTPTYEQKFFENFAKILIDKEPELLKKCVLASTHGQVGCVLIVYTSISDFASGAEYTMEYMSLSTLRLRLSLASSIDWNGYARIQPSDNFVLAMTAPSLDGVTLVKTVAVQDDGGPPDATEIQMYPKVAFSNMCMWCKRGVTHRSKFKVLCEECNTTIYYCSKTCYNNASPHHDVLYHLS